MLLSNDSLRTRISQLLGLDREFRKMMPQAPQHPVERNIIERLQVLCPAGVIPDVAAANIGVSAGKPYLLGHARISLEPWFSPYRGLKRLAMLVDRQGVKVYQCDGR